MTLITLTRFISQKLGQDKIDSRPHRTKDLIYDQKIKPLNDKLQWTNRDNEPVYSIATNSLLLGLNFSY